MRTVEVAEQDWPRVLQTFSHTFEGVSVSVDVFQDPPFGVCRQINHLPLRGIVVETQSDETTITIAASRGDGEHITRIIHSPTHVRLEKTNAGEDVAVDIESDDGVVVLVRPEHAPAP